MKVVKYDKATNTYSKPFDIDFPPLLTDDMSRMAECPDCHKKVPLGTMVNCGNNYTVGGVWLIPVCPECAKEIWDAQKTEREKR